MKRLFCSFLIAITVFSLSACKTGNAPVATTQPNKETVSHPTQTQPTATEETLAGTQETTTPTVPDGTAPTTQAAPTAPPENQPTTPPVQQQPTAPSVQPTTPNTPPPAEELIASGICVATNGKWKITKDGTFTLYGNDRPEDKNFYTWSPYADQVKKIVIENGIVYIPIGAFFGFRHVTEVILADSVEAIAKDAFSNCYELSKITIPRKVKELNEGTFAGCSKLTTLSFAADSQLTTLHGGCVPSGLTKFVAPPNLTSIGVRAFAYANKLEEVILDPDANLVVDNYAFEECRTLKKLVLGKNVIQVAGNAFSDCYALGHYESHAPVNIDLRSYPHLHTVIISGNVSKIPSFMHCTSLKNVTITTPITTISNSYFMGCSSLTTVAIPNTVTTIENYAFVASGIQELTIPASIKELGMSLFNNTTLQKITFKGDPPVFKSNVTDGTFSGLGKVTAYYPANNPAWTEDILQNYGASEVTWIAQ